MGLVNITLEDDTEGQIACKVTFDGGWNGKSGAHQHARMMLDHMDSICTKAPMPAAPEPAEPSRIILEG